MICWKDLMRETILNPVTLKRRVTEFVEFGIRENTPEEIEDFLAEVRERYDVPLHKE